MPDEKPMPDTIETVAQKVTALAKSIDARFVQVDARFEQVDARFGQVDARFGQVDARFTALNTSIDKRFAEVSEAFVEQRQYTELAFDKLRTGMNGGFTRLERKLDRVLATLTRTLSPRRRRRS